MNFISGPQIICLPFTIKISILITCILGGLLGYIISNISFYFYNKILNYNLLRNFLGDIWFMPVIFTLGVIKSSLLIGKIVKKNLDYGWSEYFGVR